MKITLTPSSDEDAYGDSLTTSNNEDDFDVRFDDMISPRQQICDILDRGRRWSFRTER